MPLFDFVCHECSHPFEALVFNGEAVECPECKSAKVDRQLSLPARPRTEGASLPMGGTCNSSGPPCGPACRRWPAS